MRDACLEYLALEPDEVLGHSGRFVRLEPGGGQGVWVYLGESRDYILVEGLYCSCPSMAGSLVKGGWGCKHLRGLKAAVSSGRFRRVSVEPGEVRQVVLEVYSTGLAVTVRRRLSAG
ncbi:hypothetical protein APE_0663 [Aeropyrum pernix K1]|uniref:SWIM-type domain-containing protein n=1 Tax=Aeropyrum pernix (strain ATCC 700893 / DSM 11879 / JCM 9820 / NBRC 100138 / K1) TaxID=272557 RepID=Q9YEB1_AERPE|nr:SWIM zinc finger family protein [Aeropyrum pernix]BAA79635.1 hypothetical protein APE_0663 [Aeropyrum pernix K1]